MSQNTPPKNASNKAEWTEPPSPASLQTLYLNTRKNLDDLKAETKDWMHRLVVLLPETDIRETLLAEEPLTTHYEIFYNVLEEIEEARNKLATIRLSY